MGSGQVFRRVLYLILLTLSYSSFIQSAPTTSNSAQVPNTLLGVDHNESISIQTNKETRISSSENNDMSEESSSAGTRKSKHVPDYGSRNSQFLFRNSSVSEEEEPSLSPGVHPTSSSSQAIRSTSIQESLNKDPRFDFTMSRFTNPFIDYLEGNDSSEEIPIIRNSPKVLVSQILVEVFESDRAESSERDNPDFIFLKMGISEIKSSITNSNTDESTSDMKHFNANERYFKTEIQDANQSQENGFYIKNEWYNPLILKETDSEKSDENDFDEQNMSNTSETSLSKSNEVEDKNWRILHNIRHRRSITTTENTNTKLVQTSLNSDESAKGPATVCLNNNPGETNPEPIQRPYVPFITHLSTNIETKSRRNVEQLNTETGDSIISDQETLTPITKYLLLVYRYPFETNLKHSSSNDSETLLRSKRNSFIPPTEITVIMEETGKPNDLSSTTISTIDHTTEGSSATQSQINSNVDLESSPVPTTKDKELSTVSLSTVTGSVETSSEPNNMEMSTANAIMSSTSSATELNTLESKTQNEMNEILGNNVDHHTRDETLESQSQNEPRSGDEDISQFAYQVSDSPTHSFYSLQETQKGDVITGSYRILLPDGRTEIVKFTADDEGYHPVISWLPMPSQESNPGSTSTSS